METVECKRRKVMILVTQGWSNGMPALAKET
jgi:hypothetical protein